MLKGLQGWLVDAISRLKLSLVALHSAVKNCFWLNRSAPMDNVVIVTTLVCRYVDAWLDMSSSHVMGLSTYMELSLIHLLLEAVLEGNRRFFVVPLRADAYLRGF